ncbi:hypothetical protein ACFUJR_07190 [Streptomyces sp. NPDC057271]|uniref:hypothetical protein n=1 Tax=unclassified Streptomyces TaxID=2593676 RepID=UPI003631CB51
MLYKDALIVDYGPGFRGQALKTDHGIVCAVPSQPHARNEARTTMRELVRTLGGSCDECRGCLIRDIG